MAIPAQHCDFGQLEKLIEQDLSEEATQRLEKHLSDCPTCQRQLEQLVGSSLFWQNTQSRLAPEHLIQSLFEHSTRIQSASSEASMPKLKGNEESALRYVAQWLAPTDDPHSMGRLGSYEVMGLIGIGGMGIVVKGFDPNLNRSVAIKLLSPHLALNGSARQRFSREAKAAAAVTHENVLAIHAIETQQDIPYLVMPYIKGASLEKRVRQDGALPLIDLLRIAHQIAMGLAEAHAQGLVHRDVKPANILLATGSERLKISDFGLARAADDASLTRSGTITGTPLYMSPEQARGEPVDQRSDIFSFGSLLYEVCTGHPPFRAETPFGILRRIGEDTPRPIQDSRPEAPVWLCSIIESMMAKSPADRTLTAKQLAELFRVGLTHQQQPVGSHLPEQLVPFVSKPHQNSTAKWLCLALVSAILISLAVWTAPWPSQWNNSRAEAGAAGRKLDGDGFSSPNATAKTTPRLEKANESKTPKTATTKTTPNDSPSQNHASKGIEALNAEEANRNEEANLTAEPKLPEADSSSEAGSASVTLPPSATGSTTSEPVSLEPIEVVENPTIDDSLLYQFAENEVIGYEIDLNLHRQDGSLLIDGQILLEVDQINDDSFEFKYRLILDYQRIDSVMLSSPFAISLLEGELGQLQRCEREGRFKVAKDGRILGRSRQSELPAQLGPIAEFIFPRLPKKKRKSLQQKSELSVHSVPTTAFRSPTSSLPSLNLNRVTKTSSKRTAKRKSDEELSNFQNFTIRVTDKTDEDADALTVKSTGSYQFDAEKQRVHSMVLNRTLDDEVEKAKFAKLELKLNSIPSQQLPKTIQQNEDDQ